MALPIPPPNLTLASTATSRADATMGNTGGTINKGGEKMLIISMIGVFLITLAVLKKKGG